MTAEFKNAERLESIAKAEAKKLRYCGFDAKGHYNWSDNVFAVKIKNISDADFNGMIEYQKTGVLSDEIQIIRI